MLTLWYIILGWKEYNKPFRKAEGGAKPEDPAKKPDLIPQKKDGKPSEPQDIKKPEPPKSIPIDPRPPSIPPRAPEPLFPNNKVPDTPKVTPPTPETPKLTPEVPKMPELPKVTPKTPEIPKMPEIPKVTPKTPEIPKMPELPKVTPKTPETPKLPELPKMTPEPPKFSPKTPESPKVPELPKFSPKTPETPKMPEAPKPSPMTPELPKIPDMMPSRRPESVMPNFPPSSRNPAQGPPSEFPLPPFVPGAPGPLSRDDELFSMGNSFNTSPNKPLGNLRDLSYSRGEFPGDDMAGFKDKVQENLSRIPKYMEQSIISDPDSLESEEEDDE